METTNNDDDWLSLGAPAEPIATTKNEESKVVASKNQRPMTSPTPLSNTPEPTAKVEPDEFRLAPQESNVASPSKNQSPKVSTDGVTAGKSVFDEDLPDLAPFDELPVSKPISSGESKPTPPRKPTTAKPQVTLPDIALPDLDLSDIPLAPLEPTPSQNGKKKTLLVGSLEELSLESPALIGPFGNTADEEFSFPCKLCGSLLGASHSKIGTQTRCPDCYSTFSIPSPPKRNKLADVKLDAEVAKVTFAPIDSLSVHGTNNSSEKTKEILDRAEQTMEAEREEFQDLTGTFDTKRWMGVLFGFLRDPLVIAAAIGLGFVTGFWLFSMAAMGTMVKLGEGQAFIARLVILVVFFLPVAGAICMCGIAILTMGANRTSRVKEWPFARLSESIGECTMVFAAVMAASIPGGMLGVVFRSLNAHPMITLASILLGIWALTPILLLCMIDNSSIFEPYSKAVINSIKSHSEAWGAMYMQTAMAFAAYFLYVVLTSIQRPIGDLMAGLLLPLACFFVFHQYGVIAGRISQVTEMGFEGDFSQD